MRGKEEGGRGRRKEDGWAGKWKIQEGGPEKSRGGGFKGVGFRIQVRGF